MKIKICLLICLMLLFAGCTGRDIRSESSQPQHSSADGSISPDEAEPWENPEEESRQPSENSAEESQPQEENREVNQGTGKVSGEPDTGAHNMGRGSAMHLSSTMDLRMADEMGIVEYYIDVAVGEDGTYYWDDAQEVTLLVRNGDMVYPLISKLFTNGLLDYFISEDSATGEHTLVVTHKTPFSVEMYEYRYDSDNDVFWEQLAYFIVGEIKG